MAVEELSKANSGGTRLGQSATDLVSLWGKTPIVQPTAAGQSAVATAAITSVASTSLTAADVTRLNGINDRVTALSLLVDCMRTAMVDGGAMKGS